MCFLGWLSHRCCLIFSNMNRIVFLCAYIHLLCERLRLPLWLTSRPLWRHSIETFLALLTLYVGISPDKGSVMRILMFTLLLARISCWTYTVYMSLIRNSVTLMWRRRHGRIIIICHDKTESWTKFTFQHFMCPKGWLNCLISSII